ncbi:hypothetical protein EDC01DRAFT_101868 [Geopyxis carbonaria]|nr:hypothetical protein EDC01DRAFT_101868 [Geopyxis carbonaria]
MRVKTVSLVRRLFLSSHALHRSVGDRSTCSCSWGVGVGIAVPTPPVAMDGRCWRLLLAERSLRTLLRRYVCDCGFSTVATTATPRTPASKPTTLAEEVARTQRNPRFGPGREGGDPAVFQRGQVLAWWLGAPTPRRPPQPDRHTGRHPPTTPRTALQDARQASPSSFVP